MAGGAPRTVCPECDEMIELGKQMVKWIKDNPDALHVSAWYSCEMFITRKTWDTMIDKEEFIPYYEQALSLISQRYLHKDSNVRDGISQRWQRSYFRDLKKNEDKDKDDDVVRQQTLTNAVPEDVKFQTQAMNDQVKALREEIREKELRLKAIESENRSEK
jgi:hypothetical protein